MSEPIMVENMVLFSGTANRDLAESISKHVGVPLGDAEITRFSDGELFVRLNENVRGVDVFIIQPTVPGPQDSLMELFLLLDAATRASATLSSLARAFIATIAASSIDPSSRSRARAASVGRSLR